VAENLEAQVASATKAVHKLPELLDALVKLAPVPAGVLLVMALVWLAARLLSVNWLRVLELLERKHDRRIAALDRYLSAPECAEKESAEVLRDLRDAYYFQAATGIYAERSTRQALIALHQLSPSEITWRRIGRVAQFIRYPQAGTAEIPEPSWLDRGWYWYTAISGAMATLGGFLMIVSPIFVRPLSLQAGITLFALGTGSLLMGLFMFSQNVPMSLAKTIRSEVAKKKASTGGQSALSKVGLSERLNWMLRIFSLRRRRPVAEVGPKLE